MILSIDPGNHAGIAYKGTDGSYTTTVVLTQEEVYDLIRLKPDHVVVEKFNAVQISKYGIYTTELVGGIKALCYLLHIPLHVHPPQGRKAFMKEAKDIVNSNGGMHLVANKDHEIDALAHLLAYEYWGR